VGVRGHLDARRSYLDGSDGFNIEVGVELGHGGFGEAAALVNVGDRAR
jgi:hypothetical protein